MSRSEWSILVVELYEREMFEIQLLVLTAEI